VHDLIGQRGPTTSDLQAILQKPNNSRGTSNKLCSLKSTDSEQLKLKKERQVRSSFKVSESLKK